jgi:hypothetical protein
MNSSAALSVPPDHEREMPSVAGLSPQESVCAGGSTSSLPSAESLRSHACDEVRTWRSCKARRRCSFLLQQWRQASECIQEILHQLSAVPPENVELSYELVWLAENARLMRAAIKDTRLALKDAPKLPQIVGSSGLPTPRVHAIAKNYLRAVDFAFSADSFSTYLGAVQQEVALQPLSFMPSEQCCNWR